MSDEDQPSAMDEHDDPVHDEHPDEHADQGEDEEAQAQAQRVRDAARLAYEGVVNGSTGYPLPGLDDEDGWNGLLPGQGDGAKRVRLLYRRPWLRSTQLQGERAKGLMQFLMLLVMMHCAYNWSITSIGLYLCLIRHSTIFTEDVRHAIPTSYDAMLAYLADTNNTLSFQTLYVYDICHICYFIFRCSFQESHFCPQCAAARYIYINGSGAIKCARKRFYYLSVHESIKRMFADPDIARALRYAMRVPSNRGRICDIYDGARWLNSYLGDPIMACDKRNLALSIGTDGVCPFKKDKHSRKRPYSYQPIVLSILNLPPWYRCTPAGFVLVGIAPGRSVTQLQSLLQPLMHEIVCGYFRGFPVHDSAWCQVDWDLWRMPRVFRCRLKLLGVNADKPGLDQVINTKKAGAKEDVCHLCGYVVCHSSYGCM